MGNHFPKAPDSFFDFARTMCTKTLLFIGLFCLFPALTAPGIALAETAETLMDRYNSQCSKDALDSLRKQAAAALKERGRFCGALAREIQSQTEHLEKKETQPLARPDLGGPPR